LIINEKRYRKKSPEAIALEATSAHYFLFYFKDIDEVANRAKTQMSIDLDLDILAFQKNTDEKVRAYVS